MTTQSYQAEALEGRTVYSTDGDKLGKVDHVLADSLGRPQYLAVKSGWFGTQPPAVPIWDISTDGDDIVVPFTKDQLKNAPTFDDDEHITYGHEQEIGRHYGRDTRLWDDSIDLTGEDLSKGPTPET